MIPTATPVPETLRDLPPDEVQSLVRTHAIVLIDVREPQEYLAERIHGALLFPMSTFDPAALPSPDATQVVFHCGSGKRSAMAVALCLQQGVRHSAHMTGGLLAWKAAGLPTLVADPATGRMVARP